MTPEAQRIAIAEACGWKPERTWQHGPNRMFGEHPVTGTYEALPNYLSDLNAMHEAEKVLTLHQYQQYYRFLRQAIVSSSFFHPGAWHATAAQRAEAFLRALNLYKEIHRTAIHVHDMRDDGSSHKATF
jgi:hypothetical protein